ncbi:hypothetical protein GQ55_8G052900 [Panicum hallii var. hallii]|uniref:DUF1618 domain-containing protein n=1 Tax=Panicum hallii var. hallii TaxID=1504633 RepID=A0A2T7CKX8_9POAL|nr:hypothetical protein GQ55_8G052900 [Panicum hallii var. hallii]
MAIHPGLFGGGCHCRLSSSSHLDDSESSWCPEGLFPRRPHHVCVLPHLHRREDFRLLRARRTAWHFRPHPRLAARAPLDLPGGHRSGPQLGSIPDGSWHSLSRSSRGLLHLRGSGKSKGYDGWRVLKRLPVRRANGDLLDLSRWSTNRVLPYRHHLIWVNYYKGMIFGNMEDPWREPTLRYVPLPVDATKGICDDWNYGRRCPEAFHNIFVTRSAIKFVTINQQYSSSSVVALNRCWSTFRITSWSLCNYSDTWIEEATLDAEEFWDLDAENQLPRVVPEFPVFNMKNPDAICFSLYEGSHTFGYSGKIWMVEVHMKKKLLLNATAYSEEQILFRQSTTKSARGS